MKYSIIFEIKTDYIKANLFLFDTNKISLIESASESFKTINLDNGGSENDLNEIYDAFIKACKKVIKVSKISADKIDSISFTCKSSSLALVDINKNPTYNALSYFDTRATSYLENELYSGFFKRKGINISKYNQATKIAGFISTNPCDALYKYNWIRTHYNEVFKNTYKWLDIKGYLVLKCTDKFVMSKDEAIHTGLVDTRNKEFIFSKKLCRLFSVKFAHLPDIVEPNSIVSKLNAEVSKKTGLKNDVDVIIGGNELYLLPLGAGAIKEKDSLIYCADSGIYINNIIKRKFDIKKNAISYYGANNVYNYVSIVEAANKCLKWIDSIFSSSLTFEEIDKILTTTELGSHGVIFAPWLSGKSSPINDSNISGLFFGLNLKTTKNDLIRAIVEGIFYQFRWINENKKEDKKEKHKKPIKLISPYLNSPAFYQLVADILGYPIEVIDNSIDPILNGAAFNVGKALNIYKDYETCLKFSKTKAKYEPKKENNLSYEYSYQLFIRLYKANKDNFLNHKKKTVNYRSKFLKAIDSIKFVLMVASAAFVELIFDFLFSKYVIGLSPATSYFIAASIALVWNFTINRKVTFYGAPNVKKSMLLLFLYQIIVIPSSAILKAFFTDGNVLGLFTVYHINIENTIATLLCLFVTFCLEFAYQKLVVFRKIKPNRYKLLKAELTKKK